VTATGFGGNQNRDVPRLREDFSCVSTSWVVKEAALPWMAVVPAQQRSSRFLELFLHAVPQPRHDDFGLVTINRLAELQRLVDEVYSAPFSGSR